MRTFAMVLKSSPARWLTVPVPDDAKLSLPGCALASAINSLTDFAGTAGCTRTISGTIAVCTTGEKSRTGSKATS